MTLETEVSSLRQVPLFRGVEPSRLKLLAFTSERVHFEAGQQLFAQGDAADAAYLLLEGSAEVSIDGPQGPFRLALLGANALWARWASSPTSRARRPSPPSMPATALRIDRTVFLELLAQFPPIAIAVMRELALRLEQTNQQLAQSRG